MAEIPGTQHKPSDPDRSPLSDFQQDFTDDQKQYLQGFVSGSDVARASRGLPTFAGTLAGQPVDTTGANQRAPSQQPGDAEALPAGPDALQVQAQNRFVAEGK